MKPSFFVDTEELIVERLSTALDMDIIDLEDAINSGALADRLTELRNNNCDVPSFVRFLDCIERKHSLDFGEYKSAEGRACLIAACHYYYGF